LGAAALLTLGCGDRPTGPEPGTLRVTLTMPTANNGLDGAILFRVSGPEVPTAAAAGATFEMFRQPLTTVTTFAVTGTLASGAEIVTLEVPDVRQSYTGTIVQVAATDYQLRGSLAGYGLSVVR
jgi:hypothetical protein